MHYSSLMLETLLFAYALLILLLSAFTDIKKREVLDSASLTLLLISIITVILYSLIQNNYNVLLTALKFFILLLMFSLLLYYARQWGGGDTKLLIALSIPLTFPIIKFDIFLTSPIDFLVNLAIVGSLYGTFFALIKIMRRPKEFINNLKAISKEHKYYLFLAVFFSLMIFIMANLQDINLIKSLLYSLSVFLLLIPILHTIFKSIESFSMIKTIPINRLTPGDWIIDKKIKSRFKISSLGIDQEQISLLKKAKIKLIQIKEGIPFVPTFLLAYVITNFYGNLIFNIIRVFI